MTYFPCIFSLRCHGRAAGGPGDRAVEHPVRWVTHLRQRDGVAAKIGGGSPTAAALVIHPEPCRGPVTEAGEGARIRTGAVPGEWIRGVTSPGAVAVGASGSGAEAADPAAAT